MFPSYVPVTPLGSEVCRLDILLTSDPLPSRERLRVLFPGPVMYGSRIFDEHASLVTSFTSDEFGQERYWVTLGSQAQTARIVRIETYYHLLLMQKPLFSAASDH